MISCCLIVKDEVDVLGKCIESVKEKLAGVVDEIVVADTGSTDGTRELAVELGCVVCDFEWCDDFAKARNFSVEHAKNDWILILDADEYIEETSVKDIKSFLKNANNNTIAEIDRINVESDGSVILEESIVRLYNKKNFDFRVRIHERLRQKKEGHVYKEKVKLRTIHTGYIKEKRSSKSKDKRNSEIIEKELEENMVYDLLARLGDHYVALGESEKAIAAYEKFLEDENTRTLPYYIKTAKRYLNHLIEKRLYKKALDCEKYWNYCKEDDEYVYKMAVAYSEMKENNKAVECYLNCVNRNGETIIPKKNSYFPLGVVFEHIGDLKQALLCYKLSEDIGNAKEKVIEIEKKLG